MRLFKYLTINCVFSALLYFGYIEEIEGAENVALFIAWVASIATLFSGDSTAADIKSGKLPLVPRQVAVLFDFGVVCVFVWFEAWWTGAMWLMHIVVLEGYYSAAAEKLGKATQ